MHNATLQRILRVIACGSAALTTSHLAACNDDPAPELPKMTESMLGCTGEETENTGPCCTEVECYEPALGQACALPPLEGNPRNVTDKFDRLYPFGSGLCFCDLTGPYEPESSRAFTEDTGSCCYIISTQGCTGRPLTCGDGEVRVAPVSERTDWA